MGASNRVILRGILAAEYQDLLRRLAWKFGSWDFARDTLHDTFVRLEQVSDQTALRNPKDYLFRIAVNVGKNRRRAENLRASAAGLEALLDVADDTPDPANVAEMRSEMDALLRALDELPARTRKVYEAAVLRGRHRAEIAEELGVSERTVERDMRHALEHCAGVLGRRR